MQSVTLNNGVEMPQLGYGVYLVAPETCERCVLDAIGAGYRSIDTAQAYYNEAGVGAAIAKCGIPRSELFITTKVWISNAGEERAAASIEEKGCTGRQGTRLRSKQLLPRPVRGPGRKRRD